MNSSSLYTIFHLNISFSSIEEEQRSTVIKKCYWPLLRLARKYAQMIGIESTGYTLESIASITPSWITELKILLKGGICEFIGSGYSQLISPLVPVAVNKANLRIKSQIYSQLLGVRPQTTYINEQAYTSSLVRL